MNFSDIFSYKKTIFEETQKTPLPQLLSHVTPLFKKHKLGLFIGFAALITVDFLQLTIPRLLKKGVDSLSSGVATEDLLVRLALIILFIAIIVGCLRFVWRYCIIGFSRYLERAIRNLIFAHIIKMDMPFFEKRTSGDIMAHASNDLIAVQMACGMGLVAAVDATIMSMAAIGFMAVIHVELTLLALLPMPFLAICTRILSARLHRRFRTVQEQFSLLTEFSRSTLVSMRLIKAYTMERFQTDEFDRIGKKYVRSNIQVSRIQGLMFPLATFVGNLGMLLILFFGGRLVILGTISMGDFVAFITYLYMLIWPMMAIGWVTNLVQRGITSLTRIDSLLREKALLVDVAGPEIHCPEPVFTLRSLTFVYPSSENPALKEVSITLGPGIHGITGRTGSGKSTICKILARLYPVPDGRYYFAGKDVNTLSLDTVRDHIGYVGQEPIVFSNTIAENIRLGAPEAAMDDIIKAARLAAIHADILEFPKQYETVIGERGVKLSGGQRQRLALARALLLDRPALLIDDGLSAVDVETEHEIFAGLKKHLSGKTVIIVSNRLKLLTMTDHIVILEEGSIINDGRHEQLLQESSFYRSMYNKQMREDNSPGADYP